jgi:hypothetical protein
MQVSDLNSLSSYVMYVLKGLIIAMMNIIIIHKIITVKKLIFYCSMPFFISLILLYKPDINIYYLFIPYFTSFLLFEDLNINIIQDFFNLHTLGGTPELTKNPYVCLSNSTGQTGIPSNTNNPTFGTGGSNTDNPPILIPINPSNYDTLPPGNYQGVIINPTPTNNTPPTDTQENRAGNPPPANNTPPADTQENRAGNPQAVVNRQGNTEVNPPVYSPLANLIMPRVPPGQYFIPQVNSQARIFIPPGTRLADNILPAPNASAYNLQAALNRQGNPVVNPQGYNNLEGVIPINTNYQTDNREFRNVHLEGQRANNRRATYQAISQARSNFYYRLASQEG